MGTLLKWRESEIFPHRFFEGKWRELKKIAEVEKRVVAGLVNFLTDEDMKYIPLFRQVATPFDKRRVGGINQNKLLYSTNNNRNKQENLSK